MGKIDLIDNGWVDLVFDGKNQAYGAYQLRKDTGRRNLKALITMFLIFAAIAAIVIAKVSIENYIASQNAAIEADVELQSLAEKKEAKAERKEEPEVEKIEIERVKSSVAFTVPEIKKDEEVKEEQEIKSQDELQETNTAIGAFNVEGNDETAGEVLKAKEVIAEPEPPKVEERRWKRPRCSTLWRKCPSSLAVPQHCSSICLRTSSTRLWQRRTACRVV